MRLFLIENKVSKFMPLDTTEDVNAVIEFAQQHCAESLREFYGNGVPIYRGLSNIITDYAYVISTEEVREPRGGSLSDTSGSFNTVMKELGHSSRINHAAFTTTTKPKDYHGVPVEYWFYFLPIGEYAYTYLGNGMGTPDFNKNENVDKSVRSINNMKSRFEELNQSAALVIRSLKEELANLENNGTEIGDFEYPRSLHNQIIKVLTKIRDHSTNALELYSKGIFKPENLDALEKIGYKLIAVKPYFLDMSKEARQYIDQNHTSSDHPHQRMSKALEPLKMLPSVFRIIRRSFEEDVVKNTKELFDSWVTDKLTNDIKNNEVVFNCDKYLMIPVSHLSPESFIP